MEAELRAGGCCRCVARERPGAPRLRRGRLLAPVRAHLHQHPHSCSTSAASPARGRPRRGRPARDRGRPLGHAPRAHRALLDAIVIGDGEEPRRARAHVGAAEARGRAAARAAARPRQARGRVRALASTRRPRAPTRARLRGRPAPRGALPREARARRRPQRVPLPDDGPVARPEAVFDRISIEIARGCTEGCRFCQAGMIYRPCASAPREQSSRRSCAP
jgi:hypothetical protein